jgi:uncharacterized coiled-coil DUF342 family protein
MDELTAAEARQRIARWVEEGQRLLGQVLPELLEELGRLRRRADELEQANARLRQELTELQHTLHGLRLENQVLRRERSEIEDGLARLVAHTSQMLAPMNEMLARFRPEA